MILEEILVLVILLVFILALIGGSFLCAALYRKWLDKHDRETVLSRIIKRLTDNDDN